MMIRRGVLLLAGLAILLGCGGGEAVKVGAVLPLTGEWAIYGQPIKNGVELAYNELVEEGDFAFPIELSIVDSASNATTAKEALAELYGGGTVAVIGGATSTEALQMVPVADQYDRVLLSPSASNPELTGISKNFYRVFLSDAREGTTMASFAFSKLGIKSAVILSKEEEYAKGIEVVFANEFERQGGEVLDSIRFPATSDVTGLVERVLTLTPEAVYIAAYAPDIARLLTALRGQGYEKYIFTTSAFSAPAVIEQQGEAAEGVFLTQTVFEPDSEEEKIQTFVNAYRESYGVPPDLYAAHGYDAMMVLAEALRTSGPIASDFWKGITSIREFSGVTGMIQFDERGDVQKFPRVYVVEEGNLIDYEAEVEKRRKELLDRLREIERRQRQKALGGGGD
jgi:branched-chain amino acid transport system substrate-binding protein